MKISAAIRSWGNWLRRLLRPRQREVQPPVVESGRNAADPLQGALAFLEKTQAKVDRLAADFNGGTINRAQFRSLYAHYQRQIQSVESIVETISAAGDWKGAVPEGQSVLIRRKHSAKAVGYAIFENDSGMPISTLGQFELDPALVVPMLASYRSAAREAFGAGTRSAEMEDGRWLGFVPGEFTTMLALLTGEPAGQQLQFLGQLHRQFERANRRHLASPPVEAGDLLFPHEYYLGHWHR